MRDSLSLLGIVGVFCAVVGLTVGHYHDPWAAAAAGHSDGDEQESQPGGFSVVSGPMEDDVSDSWPWAHHVDFNERFPGEDQIAEESVRAAEEARRDEPRWEPRLPQTDLFDDLVVPDFARMFNEGPQIGDLFPTRNDPEVESIPQPQGPVGNYDVPWWNLFGLVREKVWWKGSNVCVKREEEESQSEEDSVDGSDGFRIQFSMCSHQDTRFVCVTRQQGNDSRKLVTVRTQYECCQGFELDEHRTSCVRGGNQDILTTIEQIGGTEFIRLVRMVGLESKLKRQNLTVFVPSNEALVKYTRARNLELESNSIQFVPKPEKLMRERRSILMHAKNEPGGRNVRRRGGETKGRHSMMRRGETEDLYPTDISSSSEEDGEQETGDVVRIPVVKRKDPSMVATRRRPEGRQTGEDTNFGPYYGMDGNKGELEQMLLNQMLAGKLSTDDFIDEKVLFTENVNEQANHVEAFDGPVHESHREPSQGSVVRLNTWFVPPQGQMFTVNCVPITSMNNKCSNGMVHVVSDVFQPVTQSIGELLASDPQLSMFRSYLHTAGLLSMLEKSDGHLTLLAPTNEALESADASILTRMMEGGSCLKKILRRHILPITLCSSVVQKEGKAKNIDLDVLDIVRDVNDRMFINGSELIKRDSVATNGVLHVVNRLIVSDNDKKLREILLQNGFTTFVGLTGRLGINLDEMENITVFAPSDDALARSIDPDVFADPKQLRELILFHISRPETSRCSLKEKETLTTLVPEKPLHVSSMTVPLWPLISSFPLGGTTVQCAKIEDRSGQGCNGVFHEIDRLMIPPQFSVYGVLQDSSRFTIFADILFKTVDELMEELLGAGNATFTVFAPTDEAFNALGRSELQRLRTDKKYAMTVVNRHVFRDAICSSEAYPGHNLFFRTVTTFLGNTVPSPISKNQDGSIQFGRGSVTQQRDMMALNGIVHAVDTVSINEVSDSNTRNCRSCGNVPQFQFFNFGR